MMRQAFAVAVGLQSEGWDLFVSGLVGKRWERGGGGEGWCLGLVRVVGGFAWAMVLQPPPALSPPRQGLKPKIRFG